MRRRRRQTRRAGKSPSPTSASCCAWPSCGSSEDKVVQGAFGHYDHIVIDEAQDFSSLDLEIILAATSQNKSMTIVADEKQHHGRGPAGGVTACFPSGRRGRHGFWRDLLGFRLVAGLGAPGYRHYFFEISPNDLIAFFEWTGVDPVQEKEHGRPVHGPFVFDHVSFGVEY